MTSRALIVIDVQNEYDSGALPIEFPALPVSLPNIGHAMDAASRESVPIVVVQHATPPGSPVFAEGSHGWELHEVVASRRQMISHLITKAFPSAFVGTDLEPWLRERGIDTVTVVGYLTNNCDQSTVINAAHLGFAAEFLGDASGAVSLSNESGHQSAEQLHEAFLVVLQSNFAAVMTTEEWVRVLVEGAEPVRSNLLVSHAAAQARDDR